MASRIKELLAADKTVRIFGVGRIPHTAVVEMLALHGGFDAVWLDQEHCGLTYHQIESLALACRAHALDSFVRLAPTDYASITRALEAGAGGIMAAQVRTADEAEQIVRWAKFHPRGLRGTNNGGVDGQFGLLPLAEFAARANRDSLVAIQIETVEAVANADAIAAVPDVDLLFVGPADLSQAMGVIGDFQHPKCLAAIDRVATACKNHRKHWGVVPISPEYAAMLHDKGCRMFSVGSDNRIINVGIEATKTAYQRFF